jgi:hypothetical protein
MDVGRPQSAPTQRLPSVQRPLTAPASRNSLKSLDGQRVRFSEGPSVEFSDEEQNSAFWALQGQDKATNSRVLSNADLASKSGNGLCEEQAKLDIDPLANTSMQPSEKRVSFKGLHMEKAAIDEYRSKQQSMALRCVTSLEGWEETKNSLIASIQSVTSPDIALTDKARKTVLNSLLCNFFALLHVPSFKVEYLNLELELQSKVPSFLLQLQKDVKERQGMENTVDLNERETKQGILGTYGKQFMIETFINGISLARPDEESNLVVRRAALNDEFRKLHAMRKTLETSSADLVSQRSKFDNLLVQLKSKDQRIDELERQIRRRDESHADQVANLLKEIHSLKANYSKATSVAQATTHGIQHALLSTAKHQKNAESPPIGAFMIESAKAQALDLEQKKLFQMEHTKMLAAHEKRIRMLEDALCNAQANNLSDSLTHRHSLAAMINWASITLKFEEDLYAVLEKVFKTETPASNTTLAVSGKQLVHPNSNEKLSSLLALTQEMSRVSIEISKISTQKLSKFYKVLQFSNDLLSFIDHVDLALTEDLESQKKELFSRDFASGSNDIIMFPEGHRVQNPMSSEDAELKRILGKDRKGFRNSLLDLLIEFHKKASESQKTLKTKQDGHDEKQISKSSHEAATDRDSSRRDLHDSPKSDHTKGKFKAIAISAQSQISSSPFSSPKFQSVAASPNIEPLVISSGVRSVVSVEDQSLANLTKQRDDYMERLSTLSAEMTQLQITCQDIQRQRAEMLAKTSEDSDEMAMTILELKRDKDAVFQQTNKKYAEMAEIIHDLKQEREELRNQLRQFSEESTANAVQDSIQLQDDRCEHDHDVKSYKSSKSNSSEPGSSTSKIESNSALRISYHIDASCQTIEDWQSSKISQIEIKSNTERLSESVGVTEMHTSSKIHPPVSKAQPSAEMLSIAKPQAAEFNKIESTLDLKAMTAAAQMILSATNRNLQTNFSNQRVQSFFDEFDESARNDAQGHVHVPKIDLSSAFLQSVGESQVHHFQQNGSYLPRFQKVAIKQKIEQNVGFSAPLQPRMTKNEENMIAEIAPAAISSGNMRAKKPRPGVSVLEIPNRFDIPASHFSRPPYTSRPATCKHSDLFIGADVRPETARPSMCVARPKPHRPISARSIEGNVSKRSAQIMRASFHSLEHVGAPPSPHHERNPPHGTPQASNVARLHVDCLNVVEAPEIETHSSILNEYLNGISVGLPS